MPNRNETGRFKKGDIVYPNNPRDCGNFRVSASTIDTLLCVEILGTVRAEDSEYYRYCLHDRILGKIPSGGAGPDGGYDDSNLSPATMEEGDIVRLPDGTCLWDRGGSTSSTMLIRGRKGVFVEYRPAGYCIIDLPHSGGKYKVSTFSAIPIRSIGRLSDAPLPSMHVTEEGGKKGEKTLKIISENFYEATKAMIKGGANIKKGDQLFIVSNDGYETRCQTFEGQDWFVRNDNLRPILKKSTRFKFIGIGERPRSTKGFWLNRDGGEGTQMKIVIPHGENMNCRSHIINHLSLPFREEFISHGNIFFELSSNDRRETAREIFMRHCRDASQEIEGATYGESNPELSGEQQQEEALQPTS